MKKMYKITLWSNNLDRKEFIIKAWDRSHATYLAKRKFGDKPFSIRSISWWKGFWLNIGLL